jgi:hypothetical protein
MKKVNILVILILILGTTFIFLDRQLFYYGKNILNVYHRLPLSIKPEFRNDFEGGFVLRDKYGFSLVNKGICQFVHSDIKFTINEIMRYGFMDDKLVAIVKDSDGHIRYIEFLKNIDINSNQDLLVNLYDNGAFMGDENLNWIDINKDNDRTERRRNIAGLIMIIVFTILFIEILKYLVRQK